MKVFNVVVAVKTGHHFDGGVEVYTCADSNVANKKLAELRKEWMSLYADFDESDVEIISDNTTSFEIQHCEYDDYTEINIVESDMLTNEEIENPDGEKEYNGYVVVERIHNADVECLGFEPLSKEDLHKVAESMHEFYMNSGDYWDSMRGALEFMGAKKNHRFELLGIINKHIDEYERANKTDHISFLGSGLEVPGVWDGSDFETNTVVFIDRDGIHDCPYGEEDDVECYNPTAFDDLEDVTLESIVSLLSGKRKEVEF